MFHFILYFYFLIERDEKYRLENCSKYAPNLIHSLCIALSLLSGRNNCWGLQNGFMFLLSLPLSFLKTNPWIFGKRISYKIKINDLGTKLLVYRLLNLMVCSILHEKWSQYPRTEQGNKLYKSTQKEITLMTSPNLKKCQRQTYKWNAINMNNNNYHGYWTFHQNFVLSVLAYSNI